MDNNSKDSSKNNCVYQGKDYSDGSIVCQAGVKHQCRNGNWDSLGETC